MNRAFDNTDGKIIYELEKSSRQPDSEIAKACGLSKQVVRYRIERMISSGTIQTFQTAINYGMLGLNIYGNIYIKLQGANKQKQKEIMDYLVKSDDVVYIASVGGQYDLSIVLVARTLQRFIQKLDKITSEYPENLSDRTIALRVLGQKYNKSYLLDKKAQHDELKKKRIILEEENTPYELDGPERKILSILATNSRASLVEMSKKTSIPISTLHTRIRKLISAGVISGFPILLDLRNMGLHNYKALISFKDQSTMAETAFYRFCTEQPNITWFFKTISEWTHEVRVEVPDEETYQDIILDIRSRFGDSIGRIETLSVFKEHKEDYFAALADEK